MAYSFIIKLGAQSWPGRASSSRACDQGLRVSTRPGQFRKSFDSPHMGTERSSKCLEDVIIEARHLFAQTVVDAEISACHVRKDRSRLVAGFDRGLGEPVCIDCY
jgi:hypothetical protein